MKNRSLFVLLAAVLPLLSCGTVSHSAFQGGGQFRNSIYYSPGSRVYTAHTQADETAGEASQQVQAGVSGDTRTVYIGEANEVNINYEPGATYAIVDDDESYAARLRKFDSPTYTINIDFVEPYYWTGAYFGWYAPWWGRHYAWYGPGWHWHWDSYWHNPWYDHLWGRPHWAWHHYWNDLWWGPVHHPIYAPWPGHGHIGGPGYLPGHGRPGRDVYYGKRNSGSTYHDVNRGSVTSGRQNANSSKASQGSVTRRPSRNQSGTNVKPTETRSNNSSYTRSSGNQYNRSGASSYGSGYNRGSYNSSGATRSQGGGGSSYRRR